MKRLIIGLIFIIAMLSRDKANSIKTGKEKIVIVETNPIINDSLYSDLNSEVVLIGTIGDYTFFYSANKQSTYAVPIFTFLVFQGISGYSEKICN